LCPSDRSKAAPVRTSAGGPQPSGTQQQQPAANTTAAQRASLANGGGGLPPSPPHWPTPSRLRTGTLPSGEQYEVVEEGTGRVPKANDTVKYDWIWWRHAFEGLDKADHCRGAVRRVSDLYGWERGAMLSMREGETRQIILPDGVSHVQLRLISIESSATPVRTSASRPQPSGTQQQQQATSNNTGLRASDSDGFTVTPLGARHRIVTPGIGRTPAPCDRVTVDLIGWGDGFGGQRKAYDFHGLVARVSDRLEWEREALLSMREGETRQIVLPPGSVRYVQLRLISIVQKRVHTHTWGRLCLPPIRVCARGLFTR